MQLDFIKSAAKAWQKAVDSVHSALAKITLQEEGKKNGNKLLTGEGIGSGVLRGR